MGMESSNSYKGNIRILFLTTFAFFVTFVVWFNMAPFVSTLQQTFNLTDQEIGVLLTMNLALTIPARVLIGMLVDRFGPRKVYFTLLFVMSIPCFTFALGNSFTQLMISRMFLAVIGSGFVIGIRMVSEWFPSSQAGMAQGFYGGWGNFGSAAAAFMLPLIALYFFGGVENGWRWTIGLTGLVSLIYSFIYYFSVRDTPPGKTYQRPKRNGAMEVSSYKDLVFLMIMTLPIYFILGVLSWKLGTLDLLSEFMRTIVYAILIVLYMLNCHKIWLVNKDALKEGVPEQERYAFRQVAILDLAYLCTFGSELAVISMLPLFFQDIFQLSVTEAGIIASSFAFMNLISRPSGGWLSDKYGRKKVLLFLIGGLALAYAGMSFIQSHWSIAATVTLTMVCSFFVQAGSGAVFSMVPLVKKNLTGQVAGMVGAYANVGGVAFLTILTFVSPKMFFIVIASTALLCFVSCLFLREPQPEAAVHKPAERKGSSARIITQIK
jgi:NNP family nitrate/nitrite transporter-like MFS transporter